MSKKIVNFVNNFVMDFDVNSVRTPTFDHVNDSVNKSVRVSIINSVYFSVWDSVWKCLKDSIHIKAKESINENK